MNLIVAIYSALLFYILSPGILINLPLKLNKWLRAGVHAILFAFFLHGSFSHFYEGMVSVGQTTYTPDPTSMTNPSGPPPVSNCTEMTLNKTNNEGQVCQKKGENYIWVIPCNLSNVGKTNVSGQRCTSQDQRGGNAVYNWV